MAGRETTSCRHPYFEDAGVSGSKSAETVSSAAFSEVQMPSHEDKVNEFLSSMGFGVRLAERPPNPPYLTVASVNHMGLLLEVWKDRELFLSVSVGFGFVPKAAVAPLFRRMLELQSMMAGPFFALHPGQNVLFFQVTRSLDGLELIEFKTILDTVASCYWQHVLPLIQQFQIPQQQPV